MEAISTPQAAYSPTSRLRQRRCDRSSPSSARSARPTGRCSPRSSSRSASALIGAFVVPAHLQGARPRDVQRDPTQPRRGQPGADRDRRTRRAGHHQRVRHRHDPRDAQRRAPAPDDARRQGRRVRRDRPRRRRWSPASSPSSSPRRFSPASIRPAFAGRQAPGLVSDPGVFRAVVGAGLYLAVLGLLGLGLGTIIRASAGAISALFGLLFVLPIFSAAVLARRGRTRSTRTFRSTPAPTSSPCVPAPTDLAPWAGFGVFCIYAAIALAWPAS